MSRKSDPAKIRQWSRRLERFGKSDQTVTDFCRAEGVSVPSFYHWKSKLRDKTKLTKGRGGRTRPTRRVPKSPAFKPVRVSPAGNLCGVTVRLPDGIEVDLGSDMLTIEEVIGQLLDHQSPAGAKLC